MLAVIGSEKSWSCLINVIVSGDDSAQYASKTALVHKFEYNNINRKTCFEN